MSTTIFYHCATSKALQCNVVIAFTSNGVCAIELADEPHVTLKRRFPSASFSTELHAAQLLSVQDVLDCLEDPATAYPSHVAFDLSLTSSPFRAQVWNALKGVPAGTTVTYAELAQKIGRPGAARAVGAAVGANPLAVLIPCHRVVGSNGQMTGYRWGVELKKLLLEREGLSLPSSRTARAHTRAKETEQADTVVVGRDNSATDAEPRPHYELKAVYENLDQLTRAVPVTA
ncbi:hypothetical protein PUNSTDRAFT_53198 [Punctularia strigosozonata HHB-11173 SS5]|uniref:uncharacterized protein n=1 Tax=Punctularia strigosozonata (strain HHB-11173) TaxID=741275 RepID=UPI0004417244|nr:uncharacterized protein PUNSTDRAFT_53198 [Punctularia strigosozonata HHB-11173 SS5]EIN07844.1 hypothetical protein PUNSTDRAFT_53198 [Punctularia strigosozonata HHB-11173 SS5]